MFINYERCIFFIIIYFNNYPSNTNNKEDFFLKWENTMQNIRYKYQFHIIFFYLFTSF